MKTKEHQDQIFNNVSNDMEKDGWVGSVKPENGEEISCWGSSPLLCAKFLNYKCEEAGQPLPNPEIECVKPKEYGKNKTIYRYVSKYKRDGRFQAIKQVKGMNMYVSGKDAKEVAMMLNWKCKEIGVDPPNASVGFLKPAPHHKKKRVKSEKAMQKSDQKPTPITWHMIMDMRKNKRREG